MARQPRRHLNERQPVLPFNDAYRAMIRRDLERETTPPVQKIYRVICASEEEWGTRPGLEYTTAD